MSVLVSSVDESSEEEESREETKEEQELGVFKLWMEVGGLLTLGEEVQKLLQEVYPPFFYLAWFSLSVHSITAVFWAWSLW